MPGWSDWAEIPTQAPPSQIIERRNLGPERLRKWTVSQASWVEKPRSEKISTGCFSLAASDACCCPLYLGENIHGTHY